MIVDVIITVPGMVFVEIRRHLVSKAIITIASSYPPMARVKGAPLSGLPVVVACCSNLSFLFFACM